MDDLSPRIERLPPAKRAQLAAELDPLSCGQKRFWFLSQMAPGSAEHNLALAFRIHGELDVRALQQAIGELVRRHEVLRARFLTVGDEPRQAIARAGPLELTIDESTVPLDERPAEAARVGREEADRAFDLAAGAPFRARLLRFAADDHVLTLVMHHIVSDERSISIALSEIAALYAAFAGGRRSPLSEPVVQYRDFVRAEAAWMKGPAFQQQLEHWKRRFGAGLPGLDLPFDRAPAPQRSARGALASTTLGAAGLGALRALGRSEGATPFMTLLAGLNALFHRYTSGYRVAIGTPIDLRRRAELEPLVGFFVNTLVIDTNVGGDATFRELVRRTRESALQAYANQDLPFDRLVAELGLTPDPDRTPLFQTMLVVREAAPRFAALPGLRIERVPLEHKWATFDLTFYAVETAAGLRLDASYPTDLFDRDTVQRLLLCLTGLLARAAREPDRRLREFPLLDGETQRRVLLASRGEQRRRADGDIAQAVLEQTARTPERTAVVFRGRAMSYGELGSLARSLAAMLQARAVGRGVLVPLLMDRGFEVVVAELAVRAAGAAFAPLDPDWPVARLATLERLGAAPWLVDARGEELAQALGREYLRVDLDRLGHGEPAPVPRLDGSDTLYVMHTSGSTGAPKGVVVPHRGIRNRLCWMTERFGAAAGASVLQTTRHVYDSSVWQIFWPLTLGGKVVIPEAGEELGAASVAALIDRERVTIADFVPSVFDVIVHDLPEVRGECRLESLRYLLLGGEEIGPAAVRSFLQRFAWVRVVNLYGPTEASIGCVFHEVKGDSPRIPIGRPIANTSAVVLDRFGHVAPPGMLGELWLSGVCLADGYLGDPERTRRVFVDNPFGELGWPTLYRTGDLVQQSSDGDLLYRGRIDEQIKINGVRVELGEVESALLRHPSVAQAVATAVGEASRRRLVAWIVPEQCGCPAPTAETLRSHLRRHLPPASVPSAISVVERLPLTSSGKVDRAALSATAFDSGRAQRRVGVSGPIEERLAALWAAVLDVPEVGASDDFFALGGHSLKAAQLVARVREQFGIDAQVRMVFESPTVAEMALAIERSPRRWPRAEETVREGPPGCTVGPQSFAQEHLWELDQRMPGTPYFNISSAVRLRGAFDVPAMERAVAEVVRRHESLRTTFALHGARPVRQIWPRIACPLEVTEVPAGNAGDLAPIIRAECDRSFDLTRGPLMRFRVLRVSPADHVVIMTLHHIVADGWSVELLAQEISALYAAFSNGRPSPLRDPRRQYSDFVRWQRDHLAGEAGARECSYWLDCLGGDLPELQLPLDFPRPSRPGRTGARHRFSLAASSDSVRRLCAVEHATPFMVLLAAFEALLHGYSGQSDLRVGTLVDNRPSSGFEDVAGMFVNTLVLRTDLSGAPPFREIVCRVRETALSAFAHQQLPFEDVLLALERKRGVSRRHVLQVLVLWENAFAHPFAMPGLDLIPIGVRNGDSEPMVSTFDLAVFLREGPGGMGGSILYKQDLFSAATIRRIADEYTKVLALAIVKPDLRVAELVAECQLRLNRGASEASTA